MWLGGGMVSVWLYVRLSYGEGTYVCELVVENAALAWKNDVVFERRRGEG